MNLRERLNLFFGKDGNLGRFGLLPVEYTLKGVHHYDFEIFAGIYWTGRDGLRHSKIVRPPRIVLRLISAVWQRYVRS